ncbi:hypothetical protein B0H19DRAFT_647051, partial [Mycena capillaripes]
ASLFPLFFFYFSCICWWLCGSVGGREGKRIFERILKATVATCLFGIAIPSFLPDYSLPPLTFVPPVPFTSARAFHSFRLRPSLRRGPRSPPRPDLPPHRPLQPSDLHPRPHPHPHHYAGDLHHPSDFRPPEFSSAFGLMDLDDTNVLAGLVSNGTPFFSTAAQGRMGLTGLGLPLHDRQGRDERRRAREEKHAARPTHGARVPGGVLTTGVRALALGVLLLRLIRAHVCVV